MANLKSLDYQGKKKAIVIRLGYLNLLEQKNVIKLLHGWLNNSDNRIDLYAYILHDHDILYELDNKTGVLSQRPKKHHIHLYLQLIDKVRNETILNRLEKYLKIDRNAIEIEGVTNDIGILQYLVHKNDLDKYQYDRNLIVHNFTDGSLDTILDMQGQTLTISQLASIIQTNHGALYPIMYAIGLNNYKNYRNVIRDLIDLYKIGELKK